MYFGNVSPWSSSVFGPRLSCFAAVSVLFESKITNCAVTEECLSSGSLGGQIMTIRLPKARIALRSPESVNLWHR